jgi:hypothetical protein
MTASSSRPATLNLTVATIGFLVNFWAWALLGPLGPGMKERLGLSFAAQSLLVAVPVVVGSLGRIPVGALTDRFGARVMFPIVSVATIVPVVTLAFVQSSYWATILVGFFLGIGGTAFAVGVPHVSAWYPPARRGFAIGVFGIGMGGTAIANFTTVRTEDPLPPGCRDPRGVRRDRLRVASRPSRPYSRGRFSASRNGRGGPAHGDLADVLSLRRRVRGVRCVQRVPARLPAHRLRP